MHRSASLRAWGVTASAVLVLSTVSPMVAEPAYASSGDAPFGGSAVALPGTVAAANYDTGGQGVAYNVTSVNGSADSYRSDGVDLEATSDTGGGYDVGWTAGGQWFHYTVDAASAGTYTVTIRVAAPSAVSDAFHIASSSGANLSGSVNVPATGGWQAWTTVTTSVTLAAGPQVLTLYQDNPGWNVHQLSFAATSGPFGGAPVAVPGTIQAANYDTGGQGVAYNVTSVNGSANSYRSDGVDLETTSDTGGGYDLGWTGAGQWFDYTVNAASAGTYSVTVRVAAPSAVSDAFHIANSSGTNLSGPVSVPATGGWQAWTTVTTSVTLPAGQQTLVIYQDNGGWNIHQLSLSSAAANNYGPPPATGGSLPSDVYVFNPGMAQSTIQADINSLYNQQQTNQFGTQRYALLFEPGTYGSASDPLVVNVGFYEEVAGLGLTPGSTVINGVVNSYNQCSGTNCQALDNFWRSVINLTINVNTSSLSGCYNNGDDFWAVSQAAPLRQVQINGNLTLSDFCENPGYASGGYIANSVFSGGSVANDSQQQFFARNSNIDGWSNGVWNQVFCGDNGAPATNFNVSGGVYTNVGSCGNTEEEPYLTSNGSGGYSVFAPALQTNSNGPNWTSGNPAGTSLPWSDFYVATPASTTDQINAALANGDDLILTPGVYQWGATINVPDANTKIIGLGFPTVVPTNGNIAMTVADVPGVNISGVIFDAGPVNSPALLQVGVQGSTQNYSSNPVTLDDVFARIGGATAGSATTAIIDNSNDSLIDDMWSWRADHGAGASWTGNPSANGLIVNGNNVSAYGLAVEHYQGYEVEWNGQSGKVVFFQNENPYDPPSQAAWEVSPSQLGYPAFYIPNSVTSFNGYGMGSYSYFDQGVNIHNSMGFEAPSTPGVVFHGAFTIFLNGSGGIDSVINGTGAAVSSGTMSSYVTSYS